MTSIPVKCPFYTPQLWNACPYWFSPRWVGRDPVSCAMLLLLYYYETLPACNPTNTLACCVSYRKAQLYCSKVFTSSVGKHSRNWWKYLKNWKYTYVILEFCGFFFSSGVAENSFLLRHGSTSMCNRISTFSGQCTYFNTRFRWRHYIASKRRDSVTHCGRVITQKNTIRTNVLTIETWRQHFIGTR